MGEYEMRHMYRVGGERPRRAPEPGIPDVVGCPILGRMASSVLLWRVKDRDGRLGAGEGVPKISLFCMAGYGWLR